MVNYMRSLIAIRICDQLNLIKNDSVFTNQYIPRLKPKQKYGIVSSKGMNPVEMRMFMDMYDYPFGPSLNPFEFPRYPPSAMATAHMNPAKIKEMLIKENSTFSAKIHEFNKLYLKGAAGLLNVNANAFPSGHPLTHRSVDYLLQHENVQLQKENADLKKRIEQMTKSKKQA